MAVTHLLFFAKPDEQREWLKGLLSNEQLWCVIRQAPPTRRIEYVSGTRFLDEQDFRCRLGVGGADLFLGNRDLVPNPVWRVTGGGHQEIDAINTQSIQYVPSRLADHILLLGQIAIMSEPYYREAGIDPSGVQAWFRDVAKSFRKQKYPRSRVVLAWTENGVRKERKQPGIIVTPGAVEWRRSGGRLKQFVEGAYEFDIRFD
jgi:hypothetical protein